MTAAAAAAPRSLVIDAFKAAACLAIVLHHLAFYGPMSDAAARLAPTLFEALSRYGRYAVQVFLVVAGFLAARSLAPDRRWRASMSPGREIATRYLRLVVPLTVTLALAVAAAGVARALMDHPSVPQAASPTQVVAHLLLLQDLLGFDSLSAGLWYVAIDFQLHAALVLMLVAARAVEQRGGASVAAAPLLVAVGVVTSAWVFNGWKAWDIAAPYFFAAYGLGVLAAWWPMQRSPRALAFVAVLALVGLALAWDWRGRLAFAVGVASILWVWAGLTPQVERAAADAPRRRATPRPLVRGVAWLGGLGYAVFLVHFPISLMVNAEFAAFVPADPWPQMAGVVLALGASIAAAALLHHAVERPTMKWLAGRRAPRHVAPHRLAKA